MRPYVVLSREPRVLRVAAPTLPELFEDAAYAVFDQGHRLDRIRGTYSRPVVAAGDSVDDLLAAWIEALLAMSRSEGIVPSYFVVDRLEEGGVQGSAAGLPTNDAPRRGPVAIGLTTPYPSPVEVPAGWWVDLAVGLEGRLRGL